MNVNLNPGAVKRLLSGAADRLDPPVAARLREAREQALLRYDARSTAPEFAWAGIADRAAASPHRGYLLRASVAVLLAAFLFSAYTYWQHQRDHDETDVDIAILTDDLPVNVYAD